MSVEERVLRLENAFATLSELAAASEDRTDKVIALLRSMDERMDQHLAWINQLGSAQANTETKLAALTDAQIKTEQTLTVFDARLAALTEAHIRTEQSLASFQERTERALAEVAARQAETAQALANLTEKVAYLVDAQARADRRLDALVDTVKEKQDGQQG